MASKLTNRYIDPTLAPYNASGYRFYTKTPSIVPAGSTFIPVNDSSGFKVGMRVTLALMGAALTLAGVTAGGKTDHHKSYVTSVGSGFITIADPTVTVAPVADCTVYTTGRTKTVGTNAPGNIINVACTDTYLVGQGILISGAGASGGDYVGVVFGIAANTSITVVPATTTSVSAGANVQHDDTAAFQAAINDAAFNGIPITAPNGIYEINGPLQGSYSGGSVLMMPVVRYFSPPLPGAGMWDAMQTVKFEGLAPPSFNQNYLVYKTQPSVEGFIIYTDKAAGNLFGGNGQGLGLSDFTNVNLEFVNTHLIAPANPAVTMVNAERIAILRTFNVQFSTLDSGVPAQPTNTNGRAVCFPLGANGSMSTADKMGIVGYFDGLRTGEHLSIGNIRVEACINPFVLVGGAWGMTADAVSLNGCPQGVTVTAPQLVDIARLNIEHQTVATWMTTVTDIADPSDFITGEICYDTSSGVFTRSGAGKVLLKQMQAPNFFPRKNARAFKVYCDDTFPLPGQLMQTIGDLISVSGTNSHMRVKWVHSLKRNLLRAGAYGDDLLTTWTQAGISSLAKSTTTFDVNGYAMWKLTQTSAAEDHKISINIPNTKSGQQYTVFIELAAGSAGRTLGILRASGSKGKLYNPGTGLTGTFANAPDSSSMTDLGDGIHYLCVMTFTAGTSEDLFFYLTDASGTGALAGAGTEFINISYPWLVPGAFQGVMY